MIDCKHRDRAGRCEIVGEIAGVPWAPPAAACRDCASQPAPRTANCVTLGQASAAARQSGRPIEAIRTRLMLFCFGIVAPPDGPGTELAKLAAWFAKPTGTCKCDERIATMNRWGVERCRSNFDVIVGWLMESAADTELPTGVLSVVVARGMVRLAIRRAERKERRK